MNFENINLEDQENYRRQIHFFAESLRGKLKSLRRKKSNIVKSEWESYESQITNLGKKLDKLASKADSIRLIDKEKWNETYPIIQNDLTLLMDQVETEYLNIIKDGYDRLFEKINQENS